MRSPVRPRGRLLATITLLVSGACQPTPSGPNLLLVTIDTLRADHVGAYGATDGATPVLDRLAAEGVRFETAIASTPITLPSHASILTGRHPPQLRVRHNGIHRLGEDEETLPERMRAAGYATAAIVGSFVLDRRFGLAQGFEHYDDEMSGRFAADYSFPERPASSVTDRAIEWLAGRDGSFLLWIHYYDPHHEYRPPAPYAERYRERPYAGEIAYVDAELGRLLDAVEAARPGDETLVAVTSDHGESLWDHGEETHSYTLYDSVLRVPLVIRGPGVPAGVVVESVVSHVDIAPTLLSLLGLTALPAADGASLVPLWREPPAGERFAYAESLATEFERGWSPLFAIRTRRYHYVRAPRAELYDVAADPRQERNLLEAEPAAAEPAAAELDARIDAILAAAPGDAAPILDEAVLEKLRAIGYALQGVPAESTGIDPKDGLPAVQLLDDAHEAYDADDFERATALLERVLERLPQSSRAHSLLGLIYLHTGRPKLALGPMETAAKLAQKSAYYRAMLGEIRQQLGDERGALEAFRAAAALDPNDPYARLGLMAEAARRGDVAAAEEHAQIALRSAPQDGVVRVRTGRVWSRMGQTGRALAALEAAVRIDPSLVYARMLLAIELARSGHPADADAQRELAGSLAGDPALVTRLALAHAQAGNLARAEASLREVLGQHPNSGSAKNGLARVLEAIGRGEDDAGTDGPGGAS